MVYNHIVNSRPHADSVLFLQQLNDLLILVMSYLCQCYTAGRSDLSTWKPELLHSSTVGVIYSVMVMGLCTCIKNCLKCTVSASNM